jgi:hypothetical protein
VYSRQTSVSPNPASQRLAKFEVDHMYEPPHERKGKVSNDEKSA